MKNRTLILAAMLVLIVLPVVLTAAISPRPQLLVAPQWVDQASMHFQGYATNSGGSPVSDGPHAFIFSLYDDPTALSPVLWTENQTLTTSSGLFSAHLGEVVPIPIDVFVSNDGDSVRALYLQVEIDTEPVLPRTLMTAVPYARVSERVLGDIETELMAMRLRSPSGWVPFEVKSTDTGTTTFQVDSFFDVEYRIEFQTDPNEALIALSGISGSSQGDVRVTATPGDVDISLGIEHEDIGARMHSSDDGSGTSLHMWDHPGTSGDSVYLLLGTDDLGGQLQIKNIGSSGEDGVTAVAVPGDAEITLKAGAQATEAHLSTSDDGSGAGLHLFDTPGTDSVDIEARASASGGRLTVSNIGSSGMDGVSITAEPGAADIKVGIESDDLGITMGASNDGSGSSLHLFDTPGTDSVNVFARASSSGGHLTVSNIGSSGEDGVSIEVGATEQPRLSVTSSTSGTQSLHGSSELIFIEPLTNDSGIFARDKMKLKDLKSGGTVDQIEIKPIELTASNYGATGDETTIRINGGDGSGGRITMEEKPAGETIPIEIVALSLVSTEPILVTRPPGSSPTDAPAMDWDYDISDRLIQTFRPPSGSSLDSVRLHGEGLEMNGPGHRYVYDSFGIRFLSIPSNITRAEISAEGQMNMAGQCLLAGEPTAACGIGGLDPAYKLFVNGDFCAAGLTCPSDVRLKRNVETIESAVDIIGQLRGVRFDWKRDEFPERNLSEKHQVGFIAQEVAAVLPEVVKQGSDGYFGVDYAKVAPVLVQAVNEQQAEIESQRMTISQMQSKLDRLERLVEQLASENNSKNELKYATNK